MSATLYCEVSLTQFTEMDGTEVQVHIFIIEYKLSDTTLKDTECTLKRTYACIKVALMNGSTCPGTDPFKAEETCLHGMVLE